jgi:DNA repair protein RadC
MINTSELGEISIGYKYLSSIENRPKITDTKEAYDVCKLLIDADKIGIQEQFVVIYLNNSNVVIGSCNAFTG